ncbi:hypothetical protein VSDG_10127 [Cytospora chrysosperma]|uniref:Uncharacterized protein n=1 Tax=Cytospora chrysosperma TaxID=252740 RepID=A0A423V7Y7_CYTCH|nr:hypothetical protein VSDG_10127 [Valsa sordida]
MPALDPDISITVDIDVAALPSRVRNLAQRIHAQLGLWPWQLLSFPSVQRSDLNPTYWSIHTIESLSTLVTGELEREAQAQAQARNNNASATSTTTTRRTRSTAAKQALELQEAGAQPGENAARLAVAERIASQLVQAVDDRVRRQTRVSRSGGTVLSTPKRPCLTCQDIRKILNVDGGKDQVHNQAQGPDEDGGDEAPRRKQKKRRRGHDHHEGSPSRGPSEELGEDLDLAQQQDMDLGQCQQQQQTTSSLASPTQRTAPELCLNNIDPALFNSSLHGSDRHGNSNKRIRLGGGRAGSGAGGDHVMHSNGSYHTSDDENPPVLKNLTVSDAFIDEHERTATIALTTTSRQETQRLQNEITKLYDSLGHLRARLTEGETALSEEPPRRAVEKVAKIQRDVYAAEAKLKERNTAEQLLSSAIQAAGTSDTISQMRAVFKSYQHETQQNYALPIASLKTALIKAQEEAAGLDTARLAAIQAKKDVEHDIAEAKKRIKMYEKRLRLWSAYRGVICLGPENLGRLLGTFPGVEGMLRTACVGLELNGSGVEGEDDRGSGSP